MRKADTYRAARRNLAKKIATGSWTHGPSLRGLRNWVDFWRSLGRQVTPPRRRRQA